MKIYQVDAFTDTLFSGNPAAVCVMDAWLDDELMQSIANENNLAETAFVIPKGDDYEIRWFTPTVEVDLCGHATLASAFVLFNILDYPNPEIRFHSIRSGLLTVSKEDEKLFLDFPSDTLQKVEGELVGFVEKCIGIKPKELLKGKTDYIAIIENEEQLRELSFDLREIVKLEARGLIVTSKGDSVDFVSRFFAPQAGVDEDPVTGSAHTSLIPIWYERLGKRNMKARQISKRGGQLFCEFRDERCRIGGNARLYLVGEIRME